MNSVKPEDFNVSPAIADKEWVYQQGVDVYRANAACMDVGQCKDFSIGIFLLKDGCGLPLHDHPGMHGCMYVPCVCHDEFLQFMWINYRILKILSSH